MKLEEEYVTSKPSRRSGGGLEGQSLWETLSSTQSKRGPEINCQREGTEEGESQNNLASLFCIKFQGDLQLDIDKHCQFKELYIIVIRTILTEK